MDHKKPKRKRAKRDRPTSEHEERPVMSLSALQAQSALNFDNEARMTALERMNQMDMLRHSTLLPTTRYPTELDLIQRNFPPSSSHPLFAMPAELFAFQGRRPQFYGGGMTGPDSLAMSRSALLSALAMDQSQPSLERRSLIPGIADMSMPGAAVGLGDSAHAGNIDPFSTVRRNEECASGTARSSAMLASIATEQPPSYAERENFNRGFKDATMKEAFAKQGDRELAKNTKLVDDKNDQLVARHRSDLDDDESSEISSSSSLDESPSQSSKKRGAAEPFPEKLHRLIREVEKAGQDHIISFTPDGKAFMIHQPEEFFSSVVPRYFKQSRFSSFKRQLNLYGFETVTSGPNKGGYGHEHFFREDPELCRHLKRRDVKFNSKPKSKLGFDPDAPDFYKMPPIMSSEEAETLAGKQQLAEASDESNVEGIRS